MVSWASTQMQNAPRLCNCQRNLQRVSSGIVMTFRALLTLFRFGCKTSNDVPGVLDTEMETVVVFKGAI